jgi:hypothetical protein
VRLLAAILILVVGLAALLGWMVRSYQHREELNRRLIAALADRMDVEGDENAVVDHSAVLDLLAQGADPNAREREVSSSGGLWQRVTAIWHRKQNQGTGSTALILAARNAKLATVKALLDMGPDINAHDKDGYTALMWAAYGTDATAKIKLLVERGADVNVRIDQNTTALSVVSRHAGREAADILLKAGAKGKDWSRRWSD